MLAVVKNSSPVAWRNIGSAGELRANEVAYTGPAPAVAADRMTALMVWDATLNGGAGNMRAMTQQEIDAIPTQKQAAKDAASPDLAAIRDNATAAFNSNATFLGIATPTTVQVGAQVKALTQQMQQVIKALALLATRAI